MTSELEKRIITYLILFILLILMYFYTYILIISLIIIALISWIEFYGLISKIYHKNKILKTSFKTFSMIYLSLLVFGILYIIANKPELKIFFLYSVLVSIFSDIGGLVFGKFFKGRKLTKISPKKTISGSIGSFIFSLLLVPFFHGEMINNSFFKLALMTILISIISQLGDLFVSYLKRKAKVKDTSDILPGHGGFLDRVDGIIFAIPAGILLFSFF